ncbi:MAG: GAF domain-containing protein [Myxococcota bacterium]
MASWEPFALLEALEDSVGVYELDSTCVYVNAATERIFGMSRTELVGRRLWDVFPSAVGNPFHRVFLRVAQTGVAESFDHHYTPWDLWFRNQIVRIGDLVHVYANDITQHLRAERRLQVLSAASHAFARTFELGDLYREIARCLAEGMGDACVVSIVEDGRLRDVAAHHGDPEVARRLAGRVGSDRPADGGLFGTVLAKGEPVLVRSAGPVADAVRALDPAGDEFAGAHSVLAVPLHDAGRTIGVIALVRHRSPVPFADRDADLVRDVADRAGMAIQHRRLFAETDRSRRRASALAAASRAFAAGSPAGLDHVLEVLARATVDAVGECAVASVFSEDGTEVIPVAVHGDEATQAWIRQGLGARAPVAGTLAERVRATCRPIRIERVDVAAFRARVARPDHAAMVTRFQPRSFLMVPIELGTRVVGTLVASRHTDRTPYDEGDEALLLDLAGRAALAIENTRVLEAERRAREAAEAGARRAAELQALTAALAEAVTPPDVARALAAAGSTTLGARLHLSMPGPGDTQPSAIAEATRRGAVLTSADAPPLDPGLADPRPIAWVVAPLPGEPGGALVVGYDEARGFSEGDLAFFASLAQQCVQALVRTRLLEAERSARDQAERVAEQTRRLEAISSVLGNRLTTFEVADSVLRESTSTLGGSTGAVWLLDEAGTALVLLASCGYADATPYARLGLDRDAPLCEAVRTRTPVYVEHAAAYAERYPASASRIREHAPVEFATACLPLVAEGRVLGGMAFAFPAAHTFTAHDRSFLEVLAHQCAQAFDRTRLLEQERAASAAHAAVNRTLNAVISASPAAIMLLDPDGTVRLWNPAAERIFGWSPEEVLGRFLPAVDEAQVPEFLRNLGRVVSGEGLSGFEAKRRTRDRGLVDVAIWGAPVRQPDGGAQCLSVVIDITDRKRAEAAALAADRRKDEFLAMLGHELRNPLQPIVAALEVIEQRDPGGHVRERAIIERQTRHLVRLVDDLMDISRITRGDVKLQRATVDLAALLAEAIVAVGPLVEQRRHRLEVEAARGTARVDGDEVRLSQVLQNLLINAAKYTPPGGRISVRVDVEPPDAVIEVSDDGMGIPPDLLPMVFDPFVQGEGNVDRAGRGLGIGLAVVRSLVHLHGGTVRASSEGLGRGSRFVVRLPLAVGAVAGPGRAERASRSPVRRRRVLLVDDNRDAADMLAELLRGLGHEVEVEYDGASALAAAARFRPEVALLDIGLPVMDGYALARRLQREAPSPVRLVAVTGYGQAHDRARAFEAGFAAHVVKPVDPQALLDAMG